ncbi:DUF6615 family protein [Roseovarius sp. Pro17]|uniref:DUF6615 family protein n=1 Tax=Roseovarius sp. Pro17 TaxID=3108175 RepID=UPI002D78E8CD|nr:DUF6615 family protein [Roseovarius sp. Pro17]
MPTLLHTFLELGDAVSRNLAFAHANDGKVSYGEETITETNLLEILRKHGDRGTQLTAISKGKEAMIGADWEWVVVGKKYSFFMRVQAKRTKKNDKLSTKHKVGKPPKVPKEQIDVLIDNCPAKNSGDITWRAVYCFYSKNSERNQWKSAAAKQPYRVFEYGCLIADASEVKKKAKIGTIQDVEDISVPWHFFFAPARFNAYYLFEDSIVVADGSLGFQTADVILSEFSTDDAADGAASISFPTAEQLNGEMRIDDNMIGLRPTNPEEVERVRTRDRRDGIDAPRFLILDVKDEPRRRT